MLVSHASIKLINNHRTVMETEGLIVKTTLVFTSGDPAHAQIPMSSKQSTTKSLLPANLNSIHKTARPFMEILPKKIKLQNLYMIFLK